MDRDFPIESILGKENLVADALSRKLSNLAAVVGKWFLLEEFRDLNATRKLISDKVALATKSVFEPILI